MFQTETEARREELCWLSVKGGLAAWHLASETSREYRLKCTQQTHEVQSRVGAKNFSKEESGTILKESAFLTNPAFLCSYLPGTT